MVTMYLHPSTSYYTTQLRS